MDTAIRIKQLREHNGISRTELARKAGISLSYLNEIERGLKSPTEHTLQKICRALGITLAEFFSEETPSLPPDLRQLLREAEILTPAQRKKLVEFIRSMKGE